MPDILTLRTKLMDAQAYAAQAVSRADIAEAEAAKVKAINADDQEFTPLPDAPAQQGNQ